MHKRGISGICGIRDREYDKICISEEIVVEKVSGI